MRLSLTIAGRGYPGLHRRSGKQLMTQPEKEQQMALKRADRPVSASAVLLSFLNFLKLRSCEL
jgi:hypothetical protein